MEKLFTDKGIAIAEAELRKFANMTPPICIHERKTRKPPYCKPFEQFQECALVVLDLVVNRQRAEIERLTAMIEAAEEHFSPLPFKNAFDDYIEKSKSEARKEFAERLDELFAEHKNDAPIIWARSTIELLLQEMESESNTE